MQSTACDAFNRIEGIFTSLNGSIYKKNNNCQGEIYEVR